MNLFQFVCLFSALVCIQDNFFLVRGQTFTFVNPREEVSNVTDTPEGIASTLNSSSITTTTTAPTTTTFTTTTPPPTTTTDFLSQLRSRTTSRPKGNFDDLLDGFLRNLAISVRDSGYDPLHLARVGPCNNCSLEGISLVRRTGPATLAYENQTLKIDAHITVPALYAACQQCFIRIKSIPFGSKIEVSIWDLSIYAKFGQQFQDGAHPMLLDYKVINDGDVDVSVSGLGVVAPAIDIGFNTFGKKLVPLVFRHVIHNEVPKLIRNQLQKITLPTGLF